MKFEIHGHNVSVPSGIKSAAQEKLAKVERFAHDVRQIDIDFHQTKSQRTTEHIRCEVTLHLKHQLVKAHASSADMMSALDLTIDKVEHQAAKIKDKRIKRRRRQPHGGSFEVEGDTLLATEEDEADEDIDANFVKRKSFTVKPMDPQEAAMQMELLGHDFYFFKNSETSKASVVYRRNDGHLGLIEENG